MNDLVYQKRIGTSAVSGQLYETKLLSLILFRALHDDDIEEFYIGTNVDGLGEFDDICIRFRVKGFDKPVAVFLQAKHRDDQNRPLTVTKTDLAKYFKSYINVRNKFNVNSNDAFFKDAYDAVECAFVFYTNTRDELDKEYEEINHIIKINEVISTGDDAFHIPYTENDVKLLNQVVLRTIIEQLAKIIADTVRVKGENYKTLMNNELMQTYHVILSPVFTYNDTQKDDHTDFRLARFNSKFFDTTDEYLQLLGNGLVDEALKDKKLGSTATFKPSTLLASKQSLQKTRKLVDTAIADDNNVGAVSHLEEKLKETVNDAKSGLELSIASAKAVYCSEWFKLPATFGNPDLTLRGDSSRKEKRLCYLANIFINLLKESKGNNVIGDTLNIVRIDDNFPDKGFLKLNGGIAGAVGNLLIFDNQTQLLMFQNGNKLVGYARTLLDKIRSEIKKLKKYRFDVKVKNFPKLSFDCNEHDKSMVVDFTKRLLFCTNQAREREVEDILKGDIGRLQNTRERCNFQMKSDAIFLAYHDEIQKWWLQQKNAEYLTKTCHVFQNSTERYIRNPLLSVANVLSKNKIIKNDIKLNTDVVKSLQLDESFSKITIIVSEVIALSIAKITQYTKNVDFVLLDFNYMISLPGSDCSRLNEELTNVEDKIFILTYRLAQDSKLNKFIKDILHNLKRKKLIIVTNHGSLLEIRKLFAQIDFFIIDDKSSLVDLTTESQENILKNTDVIFQGVHVNLSMLVDDDARVFIKGKLMDKIMSGEVLQVGEPLTNSRYEEIKDFYVNRRITFHHIIRGSQVDKYGNGGSIIHHIKIKLDTFYDIDDHAVLITAKPGMGKSSLLTHLSLSTKARDPGVWIVRINLLDYSRFFHQWTENKTAIDILEALRFICIALFNLDLNEKFTLLEKNGDIYLKDFCIQTDENFIFQINVFLHHCSRHKVIFAFDGFDEICPQYASQVIQFLNVFKHYRPQEHRIWITSRTYSKILQSLRDVFGVYHELEPFNLLEQQEFIERYLKLKLDLNELNQKEIKKIDDFIVFMDLCGRDDESIGIHYKYRSLALHRVYLDAAKYFKDEIKHVLFLEDKDKYVKAWNFSKFAMHNRVNSGSTVLNNMLELIAIPLHIYMVADYFQHQIKHVETDTIWDLNLNTYAIYEHFVETKLRKIRFEEKNQMDLYKPDVQFTFEREKKKFIDEHKKLAAYSMFYGDVDQLFGEIELEEIKKTVSTINSGGEKTGVIHTVIDDVPRFVHLTFTEYFAVEYICDKLKQEQSDDDLAAVWSFIMNKVISKHKLGVMYVLDDKLIMDDELKTKVSDARSKRIIFDFLMERSKALNQYGVYRKHWSLYKAMTERLYNLTSLFLSTLEFITPDNVHDLVGILIESRAITQSVLVNLEFTNVVLDTVREADPCQIVALCKGIRGWYQGYDGNTTNEVIIDMIRQSLINTIKSIQKYSATYYGTSL